MRLCCRPMRLKDVKAGVSLIAGREAESLRYGTSLKYLPEVWKNCLREESVIAVVIEDAERLSAGILVVGVSAFVTDEFAAECRTAPLFWTGPKLVECIMNRRSPLLGPEKMRDANSGPGLNLLVWTGRERRPSRVSSVDLQIETGRAFELEHRGFKLNQILNQPADVEIIRYMANTGACAVLNQESCPLQRGEINYDFIARPFLALLTRELSSCQPGPRNHGLFFVGSPRLFFNPTQQRLMMGAIRGSTDSELSDELGVSLPMIKKAWRSVYKRFSAEMPGLLPGAADGDSS